MKLRTLVNSNRTLQGRGVMQQWAEGKKKYIYLISGHLGIPKMVRTVP